MARSGSPPRGLPRRRALGLLGAALAAPFAAGTPAESATAKLMRGFNLPGWTDHADGRAPARAVLDKLHSLGFGTIRLPFDADPIAGSDASARNTMLKRIDTALSQLVDAGFTVILDMHVARRILKAVAQDPDAGGALAAEVWTHVAGVVAHHPATAVYPELLNEPPLERPVWLKLRDRLAAVVRARCPHHTIVWGPSRYQGIWELPGSPPLADDNQMAAIHYYTPMGFTHQCETWSNSPLRRFKNLPFPATPDTPAVAALTEEFRITGDEAALKGLEDAFATPWTAAAIAANFASAGKWSRANRCPVILDEFGVLNFCVDPVSRANWVRAVCSAAEANGIGWVYWELDQGFGFIHSRQSTIGFESSMIDAMFGR